MVLAGPRDGWRGSLAGCRESSVAGRKIDPHRVRRLFGQFRVRAARVSHCRLSASDPDTQLISPAIPRQIQSPQSLWRRKPAEGRNDRPLLRVFAIQDSKPGRMKRQAAAILVLAFLRDQANRSRRECRRSRSRLEYHRRKSAVSNRPRAVAKCLQFRGLAVQARPMSKIELKKNWRSLGESNPCFSLERAAS